MKVLLIWLGKMWQFHLQNLLQINEIKKIYAFDVVESWFKIEHTKITYSTNIDDFKDLEYDFVDIVSPTKFHYWYIEKFIKLQKNIFVEKPMVSNLNEFNKIQNLIKQTNYSWKIWVWFIERFNVVSKQFKNYISDFWNPEQVEIFRYNPWSDRIQDVDVVTDLMIHDIDLINYFFDNKEVKIIWKKCKKDTATALMEIEQTDILLSANNITQQKIRKIKFYYKDKTIIWDLILWKIEVFHKPSTYLSHKWQDLDITYMLEEKILPKTNQLKEELEEFINKINWKENNVSWLDSSRVNITILNKLIKNIW